MPRLSVGLFFDESFTLAGLTSHLESSFDAKVIGTAKSKKEASQLLRTASPTLVLMDITLQSRLCLDLISNTARRYPKTRILVISRQAEQVFAERCLRCGAKGFVQSKWEVPEIDKAIRTVLSGEVYLSEMSQRNLIGRMVGQENGSGLHPVESLTQRELQVFVRTGHGLPPREIANELELCVKTVETYRDKIKEKLGLRTSNEVSRYAMECVLFDFDESGQRLQVRVDLV